MAHKGPKRLSQQDQLLEMTALVSAITAPMHQLQHQILQSQQQQNALLQQMLSAFAQALHPQQLQRTAHRVNRFTKYSCLGVTVRQGQLHSRQFPPRMPCRCYRRKSLNSAAWKTRTCDELWIKRVEQVSNIHKVVGELSFWQPPPD